MLRARDFNSCGAAEAFKSRVERLGWTCSSIAFDATYGWYVLTDYPF